MISQNMKKPEYVLSRLQDAKLVRSPVETIYQDVVDHIAPYRPSFTSNTFKTQVMDKIVDGTPMEALRRFGNGVYSTLANPANQWFKLRADEMKANEDIKVQEWLELVEARLQFVFNHTNFASELLETLVDFGGYGLGYLWILEHPESIIYYDHRPVNEHYILENMRKKVDCIFREFILSWRQIMENWTIDDPKLAKEARENPEKELTVVHGVFSRPDYMSYPAIKQKKKYASCYVIVEHNYLLDEGGFDTFPCMVPRAHRNVGPYPRGLGELALPDTKMLYAVAKTTLRAEQKATDPPIAVSHEALVGGKMKTVPGSVNILRADVVSDKIVQLPTSRSPQVGSQREELLRQHILSIFANDLLQIAQKIQMTNTQTMKAAEDQMKLLGPMLTFLMDGLLNPTIDRTAVILKRVGGLPPPPPNLKGASIQYVSPLARAQRLAELTNVTEAVLLLINVAQVKQDVLDNVEWDALARYVMEAKGVPESIITDRDKLEQIRAIAQQKMQEQQQAAQTAELIKSMPGLAKGPEPGSPMEGLNAMLGEMTGGEGGEMGAPQGEGYPLQ